MQERKKVIIVGANGAISQSLIKKLIYKYQIHCLTRSPPTYGINSVYLRFIEGDALSPELWDQCLEGKDAVIGTFGVRETESEERNLEFTKLIVQKMKEKGVKRYIGFYTHGVINHEGKYVHQGEGYQNKERGQIQSQSVKILEESDLDWTACAMWKFIEGEGDVQAHEQGWSETPANSDGVIDFVKSELDHPKWIKKTIFLANK